MIGKENAEHYTWRMNCDGWHLVKHNQLSIIQERMPPGTSEVKHFHQKSSQFFFVLSGTATLEIAGKREILQSHQG
jgi:mannose-6-phosphate isomerase-like protein (cupin superfamily)